MECSGCCAADQHAMEDVSDSLSREVAPLGIKVNCVGPGPFRTGRAGRFIKQTRPAIEDHPATVGARHEASSRISGKQPGDPVRAVQAMVKIVDSDNPPKHPVWEVLPLAASGTS
ncbi:hypothetical protein [Microvirga vignae]|uniref:hypothetical protein n=1 Tax=Microvirga vignae TaxID=1225564 RepID=UPI003CC7AA3C